MDNSQNPNVNNEMNTASNGGVSPVENTSAPQGAEEQVSFNIGGVEVSTPTAAVQNPAPVQAQPVQAAPAQSVQAAPTQVAQSAQPQVENPTPAPAVAQAPATEQTASTESPFFTPVSVQPEVSASPVLPEPAAPVESVQSQPVQTAPTTSPQEVQAQGTENTVNQSELEVIQTAPKNRASNAVLIIFLILLIAFVLNIDTIISMYDQYKDSKNIVNPANKNTNNLTDGYILINENTSSIRLKDIKFYNFRKSQGKGITFSYEALAKYDNPSSLEIYVEIYNSEKEILYKELFNPNQKIEKDTVRTYTLNVDDDIFNNAFYALVKIYTEEEKQSTKTLTCTLDNENQTSKNTYIFVNDGLSSYEVSKSVKGEDEEALQKEYDDIKESNTTAIYENKTLTYKIDLNNENADIVTLYDKGTTLKTIKDKETLKEWNCE